MCVQLRVMESWFGSGRSFQVGIYLILAHDGPAEKAKPTTIFALKQGRC